MFSGKTLSVLAVIGFLITMTVWKLSDDKETKQRLALMDNITAECASNIKFIQTGSHDENAKDVTDEAIKELSAGGRPRIDTRWFMLLTDKAAFMSSDERIADAKRIMDMINQYNAGLAAAEYRESYGDQQEDSYYDETPVQAAPSKEAMIAEFQKVMNLMIEGKAKKGKLNW